MLQRKRRVLIAIAMIILVGMLGTSLSSFLVSRASIRTQLADSTLPLVGDTIYSEIQRDLLRPVFISSLMASNTFVHDWVQAGERDIKSLSRYLEKIQTEYDTFTVFFVSEKTHQYYHPTGVLQSVTEQGERDAWYFRLRDMQKPFEINVDLDAANRNQLAVFVNYRVVDSNGEFIGAIGVGLDISSVTQLIESYSQAFNRVVYFVDAEGKVQLGSAAHGGKADLQQVQGLQDLLPSVLSNKNQQALHYHGDGGEVFLNSRYIEELDWYLMVEQREEQMLAPITKTLVINLLISLLITAAILGLAHRVLFSYQKTLEESAHLDNLTGAFNRHAFDALTLDAVEESQRLASPVSFMFIDIDHFKSINDQYGHLAGDHAIRHVVNTLKNNLRSSDSLCRWGGEEFCVLLRNCTQEEALQVGEALRLAIEESLFVFEQADIGITASIGVAQKSRSETVSVCLQRMDDALYTAKNSGRNRVCAAKESLAISRDSSACTHVSV